MTEINEQNQKTQQGKVLQLQIILSGKPKTDCQIKSDESDNKIIKAEKPHPIKSDDRSDQKRRFDAVKFFDAVVQPTARRDDSGKNQSYQNFRGIHRREN